MCDVSDVHSDIKEHLGVVGSSLSRRIRGRSAYQQAWGNVDERTSLLAGDSVDGTAKSAAGYDAGLASGSNESVVGPLDLSPDEPSSSSSHTVTTFTT